MALFQPFEFIEGCIPILKFFHFPKTKARTSCDVRAFHKCVSSIVIDPRKAGLIIVRLVRYFRFAHIQCLDNPNGE